MDDLIKQGSHIVPDEPVSGEVVDPINTGTALSKELESGKNGKYIRFTLAVAASIPWMGSYLAGLANAAMGIHAENSQDKINQLLRLWMQEHDNKIRKLGQTLDDIYSRLDQFGEETQNRINSPSYLELVQSAFRSWDEASTEEKRELIKRLITNAGATKLVTDDLVRLFIGWINEYHESHFAVIREIYKQPGITRAEIWDHVHTVRPHDDSAEADLFRYLIRDLSTGGVIRQERDVNSEGQFLRTQRRQTGQGRSTVMESAFEDTKPYVLTKLGKQFITYVLSDVVPRIDAPTDAKQT